MIKFHFSFRKILAAYYWAAYSLHHMFFLRPDKSLKNSKLVVIGSFRTGGAGKTPFCLWRAQELLKQGNTVAILCHKFAFDEIRMYKERLASFIQQGQAKVLGTGNRYETAHQLDSQGPKAAPNYILCDDGFEDSRLRPDVIYRLDWEVAPTDVNQLIPAGKFRSLWQDHKKDESRTIVLKCYGTNPDVLFQIESIANASGHMPEASLQQTGTDLSQQKGSSEYRQTIAICGIGDPERFLSDLKKAEYPPDKTIICPDHDKNFQEKVLAALKKYPSANIIITEKDSLRLSSDILENSQIFVARQSVSVTKKIMV